MRKFYYEIHLAGAIVDGTEMFSGMLEAEKRIEEKSQELAGRLKRPFRGYMIMRIGARRRTPGRS